jgi:hypothetical protein
MDGPAERRRDCALYVTGGDHAALRRALVDRFAGQGKHGLISLPGYTVSVILNTVRGRAERETDDFATWRTILEITPSPLLDDDAVLRIVTDLMIFLRSKGRRVVAVCDFEDDLPQQDAPPR